MLRWLPEVPCPPGAAAEGTRSSQKREQGWSSHLPKKQEHAKLSLPPSQPLRRLFVPAERGGAAQRLLYAACPGLALLSWLVLNGGLILLVATKDSLVLAHTDGYGRRQQELLVSNGERIGR